MFPPGISRESPGRRTLGPDPLEVVRVLGHERVHERHVLADDGQVLLEDRVARAEHHERLDLARARRARGPKVLRVQEPLPQRRVAEREPADGRAAGAPGLGHGHAAQPPLVGVGHRLPYIFVRRGTSDDGDAAPARGAGRPRRARAGDRPRRRGPRCRARARARRARRRRPSGAACPPGCRAGSGPTRSRVGARQVLRLGAHALLRLPDDRAQRVGGDPSSRESGRGRRAM